MADVIHEFTVNAQPPRVCEAFATANGGEMVDEAVNRRESRGGHHSLVLQPRI